MTGKDVFLEMGQLDEKYIDEAEFGEFYREKFLMEERPRSWKRRPFLLAAAIGLLMLLVGCGVVYVLQMQDLNIGIWGNEQVLTFSGVKGSANYQAAQEWYEFTRSYDPDGTLRNDPQELPAKYDGYHIYTQEMADKIEEIAAKYQLKLIGGQMNARSVKSIWRYLGLDGILVENSGATLTPANGALYEGGGFSFTFNLNMPEGSEVWFSDILGKFYYSPKNCFDPFLCELSATGDWQEWNLSTASGEKVLILRSPSDWRAWVFCDRADATIALMLEGIREEGRDESGEAQWTQTALTDTQLEQLVNAVDFSIQPVPGDPALLEGLGSGINGSDRVQTQNGYTLELKSAQTDGRIVEIVFGLTVPEDVPLCREDSQTVVVFGNFGEKLVTGEKAKQEGYQGWGSSMGTQEDGDGRDNTIDILFTANITPENPAAVEDPPFAPGSQWSFYIEGLSAECWYQGRECTFVWSVDGVWEFDITFEEGDFRAVEFIGEPLTFSVETGHNNVQEETFYSLKLRHLSGELDWQPDGRSLDDSKNGRYTYIILKDGSKILLQDMDGHYLQVESPVPLDEVDHIELFNGIKLYPQNQ